ncbi:hypothetical protein VKT23_004717 [Stygiomarasmius scandens]|uniref:Uncharacterized protein n=1 Tax=Marasmiellus scandens TaxID=2682957 RepID=A0ABR1JVS7_9AGAR
MKCLPTNGTFVVFTPDFVASVARFENSELTSACKQLEVGQKKFVAFVERDSLNSPMPWKELNSFHFWILWQGLDRLPIPMKYRGIRPDMLFPVLPNTYHPTSCPDHTPISPSQPLPWKDCYMSGFVRLEIRCRTEWSDTEMSGPYQTTRKDAFEVSDQGEQDEADVYGPLLKQKVLMHPKEGSFTSELPPEDKVECRKVDDEDSDVLPENLLFAISGYHEFEDKLIVQCSTDLSDVETVNHPDELYKLLARFERLKTELETNRKLRQIEEARKIDEEHYARYPVPDPAASQTLSARLLARCGKVLKKIISASWSRYDCMKGTNRGGD